MAVRTLDELAPETRQIVEEFLSSVAAHLRMGGGDVVDETIEGLTADFHSDLDSDSSPEQARALLERFGEPTSFGPAPDTSRTRAVGSILGLPYDVRVPTAERIALRWWNPRDPHVLVPRVFGAGWDLNFGAIAVLLHLIDPDSEDEPFGTVPDRAFFTALCVPMALTVAVAVTFVALHAGLPAQLPSHFNLSGRVDGYSPATRIFLFLFTLAAIPTAWAMWMVIARRPALGRGATVGFAAFASSLASGIWALTLVTATGGPQTWWLPPVAIAGALLVPLAVFASLARAGRTAEQRRDLTGPLKGKGDQ